MSALAGRRVVVLGLGVSGVAAASALRAAGADVTAVDERPADPEEAALAALAADGVALRHGPSASEAIATADLVVTSPGVAPSSPLLAAALDRSLEVWSEPELAWRLSAGRTRLVAVTGTNGKTTTTELLAACLDAPAAGNIGAPLTAALVRDDPPPLVVAELSSFQLHFCQRLAPEVAVLLNVADDHLDWHGDAQAYRAAKARIWAAQGRADWAVLGVDDPGVRAVAAAHPPPGRQASFTRAEPAPGQVGVDGGAVVSRLHGDEAVEVVALAALRAPGPHNVANVLAATAAALCAGAPVETLGARLAAYTPGRHRLELVATVGGVRWIDDSKATNPHAAAAALASVERVLWIGGGRNKGLSFEPLAPLLAERARLVLTVGEAGGELAALARSAGVEAIEAGTVEAAVGLAAARARPGDVVLLSPACASMDQFRDYAARGEAFRAAVAALPQERGGAR